MKRLLLVGLPLLVTPAAAFGTQGYSCRTTAPAGTSLSVVVGSMGVAGATLRDGSRELSTFGDGPRLAIGQSWIDDRTLLLDLVSADHRSRVARLTTSLGGTLESRYLNGWLEYGGRRARIVCAPD